MLSQNGWPVIESSESSLLHRWIVPGAARGFNLRKGSAGFLLTFTALWFDEKVEPIDVGVWDEWGWANRSIRGSTTTSNHASGTAEDINATKHPLGKVNTFPLAKRIRIRWFLRVRMRGCIRWGGDYTGRKDDMHWEIDRSLTACEKRARKLMNTRRGRRILDANPGQRRVILS